jgi:hypothetical protein
VHEADAIREPENCIGQAAGVGSAQLFEDSLHEALVFSRSVGLSLVPYYHAFHMNVLILE